jgi:hypothetical protein
MSHFDSAAVSLRFYFCRSVGCEHFLFSGDQATPRAKIADRARTDIPPQNLRKIPRPSHQATSANKAQTLLISRESCSRIARQPGSEEYE